MKGERLNRKDLEIITLYSENPEISQEEVAKRLGLSQPTIAIKVKKLKSRGLLAVKTGLNVSKAGLHLAKVDVTATNATKILKMFHGCPYFLNGFITSGENNLCLLFAAENIATLESIVDNHLRADSTVQRVEFNIIVEAAISLILPLKRLTKSTNPPCGKLKRCEACLSYREGGCLGCPAMGRYGGWLWPT
ncbi:MAG: Lrp/AsnC family transcriptional regulator [Candidatus Bathyarchaeia archaeon]